MKYKKGDRKSLIMWLEVIEPYSNVTINTKVALKNNTVLSQIITQTFRKDSSHLILYTYCVDI